MQYVSRLLGVLLVGGTIAFLSACSQAENKGVIVVSNPDRIPQKEMYKIYTGSSGYDLIKESEGLSIGFTFKRIGDYPPTCSLDEVIAGEAWGVIDYNCDGSVDLEAYVTESQLTDRQRREGILSALRYSERLSSGANERYIGILKQLGLLASEVPIKK